MKYYKLDELLETTKSFSKTEDAQSLLEKDLRSIEAEKSKINPKEVTEISQETLEEAAKKHCGCSEKLIKAIGEKFTKLGYKVIEK